MAVGSWSYPLLLISCDHSLGDISKDWLDASTRCIISDLLPMWLTFGFVCSDMVVKICIKMLGSGLIIVHKSPSNVHTNWLQQYR